MAGIQVPEVKLHCLENILNSGSDAREEFIPEMAGKSLVESFTTDTDNLFLSRSGLVFG